MEILRKYNIVVGLEWAIFGSEAEAREDLKKSKAAYYARRKSGVDFAQAGVVKGKNIPKGIAKAYSGALVVASALTDAVVCVPIDDERSWICVVRDGLPLPGYDKVVENEEVEQIVAEAIGYMSGCEIVGNIRGASRSFDQVFSGVDKKTLRQCRIHASSLPLAPIAVILLIGATGVIGFNYLQNMEREKVEKMKALSLTQDAIKTEAQKKAEIERKRQEYLALVEKTKAELRVTAPLVDQYLAWMRVIDHLPLSVKGWVLNKVNCSPDACLVRWARKDIRAPMSASKLVPGDISSSNENEIVTRIPVQVEKRQDTSAAEKSGVILMDMVSRVGWLKGMTMKVVSSAEKIMPPSPMPEHIQPILVADKWKWSISGSRDLLHLPVILKEIDSAGITSLTSMEAAITRGSIVQVTIDGYAIDPA